MDHIQRLCKDKLHFPLFDTYISSMAELDIIGVLLTTDDT